MGAASIGRVPSWGKGVEVEAADARPSVRSRGPGSVGGQRRQQAAALAVRRHGQPEVVEGRRVDAERREGLVHHSDRGVQYLSIRYTGGLAEAGIEPSVGSVGDS